MAPAELRIVENKKETLAFDPLLTRAATTTDVYMQQIPESVRATGDAIHQELRGKPENLGAN